MKKILLLPFVFLTACGSAQTESVTANSELPVEITNYQYRGDYTLKEQDCTDATHSLSFTLQKSTANLEDAAGDNDLIVTESDVIKTGTKLQVSVAYSPSADEYSLKITDDNLNCRGVFLRSDDEISTWEQGTGFVLEKTDLVGYCSYQDTLCNVSFTKE